MRRLDSKYQIEHDMILNRKKREAIPLDEPLFLFRARDWHALGTLEDYETRCRAGGCCPEHMMGIAESRAEFHDFRKAYPERMKEPGSTLRSKEPPAQPEQQKDWQTIQVILRRLEDVTDTIGKLQAELKEQELVNSEQRIMRRNRGKKQKRIRPKARRLPRPKKRR